MRLNIKWEVISLPLPRALRYLGLRLLTWINFNPGIDIITFPVKCGTKSFIHSQTSTVQRWSLGMDKPFNPSLYRGYNYLSMLGLRLNHVSKRDPWQRCIGLYPFSWWRHHMETFSALLAICAGNSPVPGEFPAQRPVTRSFDVFFDLRLNKRLSKQSWGWWLETTWRSLWRGCNVAMMYRLFSRYQDTWKWYIDWYPCWQWCSDYSRMYTIWANLELTKHRWLSSSGIDE